MHHCKAVPDGSEPEIELFKWQIAWDGVVEIFDLVGHPRAKRCYAWSYLENDEPQYTTVLEIPPVDSAEPAVKVAIAGVKKRLDRDEEIASLITLRDGDYTALNCYVRVSYSAQLEGRNYCS